MDDIRVGSISPYDPIRRQSGEDSEGRKKRKHPATETGETEDVISLSEGHDDADEPPTGYSPSK